MQMDTAVFRRILTEKEQRLKDAATAAIAETMRETVRFGAFSEDYVAGCARDRLEARLRRE